MDRVIALLVLVAALWLSGLLLYIACARSAPPLQQHGHHNVRSNTAAISSMQQQQQQQQPDDASLPASLPSSPSPPSASLPSRSPLPAAADWSSSLPNAAIVVLTYNRPTYLRRTLDALVQAEGAAHFSLFVSQDGSEPDLSSLTAEYAAHGLTLLRRERRALLSPEQPGTAYLAQHYAFAFDSVLLHRNHSHVVVLEDDLLVSPDFLILMRDTAPLLASDPTVFCVSSWHDNGRRGLVYDPHRLFRTQYFPGLGWMMRRELWTDELRPAFPLDQWDHFMRLDSVHRQRSCIVPELSRNRNIGEQGTNMAGAFFSRFLEPIAWQQQRVAAFSLPQVQQPEYDRRLRLQLASAEVLGRVTDAGVRERLVAIRDGRAAAGASLVVYRLEEYRVVSEVFSLLSVPRATYGGVSTLRAASDVRDTLLPALPTLEPSGGFPSPADPSHWLFLVDARRVNYSLHLPDWLLPSSPHHALLWSPHPELVTLTSRQGESCDALCARSSRPGDGRPLRCDDDQFALLNSCSALRRHFPCEAGCQGGVVGPDVPNYVSSSDKPEMFRSCLVQEESPTCAASHWSAQRLCPCRPQHQPPPEH